MINLARRTKISFAQASNYVLPKNGNGRDIMRLMAPIYSAAYNIFLDSRHLVKNCKFDQRFQFSEQPDNNRSLTDCKEQRIKKLNNAMSFRYTRDNIRLTTEQRRFYEENGYLVFPGLVSQDLLDKCHKRFDDIITGRAPRNELIVMYDVKDKKSVNKVQELCNDPVFFEYMKYDKILDIVECFTGPNILAIHSMLIAKPPDIGYGTSRHPPHQDLYYFPLRPADRIVASWTAMEVCDTENGCLYVAPGTHKLGKLFKHSYPPSSEGMVNKFYHGIQEMPPVKWLNLEMQPGDTVFFHPLIIHGSGVNKSDRTRRAISCHYATADITAIETDEAMDTIRNEILAHLKKKYPEVNIKYTDIWRFKSRLVRGLRSSF